MALCQRSGGNYNGGLLAGFRSKVEKEDRQMSSPLGTQRYLENAELALESIHRHRPNKRSE